MSQLAMCKLGICIISTKFKVLNFTIIHISKSMDGITIKADEREKFAELATICSLCNDSSLDYNEVSYIVAYDHEFYSLL